MYLKEEYNSEETFLEALKYDKYGWEVIGDFKMEAFLMNLQGGFTKLPCYICLVRTGKPQFITILHNGLNSLLGSTVSNVSH